ncbi:unnamed protein product [Musa acuminata var. zebrina]
MTFMVMPRPLTSPSAQCCVLRDQVIPRSLNLQLMDVFGV